MWATNFIGEKSECVFLENRNAEKKLQLNKQKGVCEI